MKYWIISLLMALFLSISINSHSGHGDPCMFDVECDYGEKCVGNFWDGKYCHRVSQ